MTRNDRIVLGTLMILAIALVVFTVRRFNVPKLPPPFPVKIDTSQIIPQRAEFRGVASSPYTLVEFGDYQCPPCIAVNSMMSEFLKQYHGKVKLNFRNYPLPFHQFALSAAQAAEAARRQGKFWDMHDALYASNGALDPQSIRRLVTKVGLDTKKFDSNLHLAQDAVLKDMNAAKKLGVSATPTLLLCCPDGKVWMLASLKSVPEIIR